MKKILPIFAAALIFLFSGCNNTESQVTDKTAAQLAEIVVNSVQFPQIIDLSDEERIEEMGIDLSLAEDYAINQQMLSVDVCEIIIIKAKDGENEKILESLNRRRESLINDFAVYPEQVQSTAATVTGSKKNVVYLICHTDAAIAEEKLLEEI